MARINILSPGQMTREQTEVCEEALSGLRGKVPAPMIAWIHNPELARRAQMLGELLRFQTTIEPHLSEMAILICGRHWTSHLEWTAHKALAIRAGLNPKIIADIAARRIPIFDDERASVVYEVSTSVLSTGRIHDNLYKRAVEVLCVRGLTELIAILGYYCFASLTLNVFELGMPENIARELDDPMLPIVQSNV